MKKLFLVLLLLSTASISAVESTDLLLSEDLSELELTDDEINQAQALEEQNKKLGYQEIALKYLGKALDFAFETEARRNIMAITACTAVILTMGNLQCLCTKNPIIKEQCRNSALCFFKDKIAS